MKIFSVILWTAALSAAIATRPPAALAEQDIVRFGGTVELKAGERTHDVVVLAGHALVDGTVEGDVVVAFGGATLGSNAVVQGSVVVIGTVDIAQSAVVRRDIVVIGAPRMGSDFKPGGQLRLINFGHAIPHWLAEYTCHGLLLGRLIVPSWPWIWAIVAMLFALNLLLLLLFHRPIEACSNAMCKRPLLSFLFGLLMILIAPPALLLIVSTVVGLLAVPFLLLALLVALMLGKIAFYRALGGQFVSRLGLCVLAHPVPALAVGTMLICIFYIVPIVGFIAFGLAQIFALGSVVMAIVESFKPTPEAVPAPPPAVIEPACVYMSAASVAAPAVPSVAPVAPASAAPPVDLTVLPRAGLAIRIGAGLIDLILLGLCGHWLIGMTHHNGTFLLLMLAAYHILFWTWRGTTVGGSVCGLKVVRLNGLPLRFEDAVVRGLASLLSLAALGLGFFWVAFSSEKLAWHDRIAGTCLVRMPKGSPLV